MIRARYKFGDYELLVVQVLLGTYGTFNYLLCRDGKAILIDAGELNHEIQETHENSDSEFRVFRVFVIS